MDNPITAIREANLGVYRASPSRLQEDVSQEAQVANDYRGRLVYELLQNADDAMAGSAGYEDRVAFHVDDDAVWIANTGRELSDADVRGLCGLGASSKVDAGGTRRASIGHKGLGFKSVLEVTDEPAAFSTSYAFELGARHASDAVAALWQELELGTPARVPSMRFPGEVTGTPARWHTLRERGFNTVFHLPFAARMDVGQRRALADRLLQLPLTTVLFLKHLEEIEVTVDQRGRQERRVWRVEREQRTGAGAWRGVTGLSETGIYRVAVTASRGDERVFLVAHDADVEIGAHRSGLSGPAWEGVERTEVSVAVQDPARDPDLLPDAWRHFHVFLPTGEPSPYPMLVNGAFNTDLSRQRVAVTSEPADYNAHLIREAARLFRTALVPELRQHGIAAVLGALSRGDRAEHPESPSAELLHTALVDELADLPLVPSEGEQLPLTSIALPADELGESAEVFRGLLVSGTEWDGRRFPDAALCHGDLARTAADHGARALGATTTLELLAHATDDDRTRLLPAPSRKFDLDPVLELAHLLWEASGTDERHQLEQRAKELPIFPVHRREDGRVERIALGDRVAFYPPMSTRRELPLDGLAFLAHEVCWGRLLPPERTELLGGRMTAWQGLFDIREFRFEEVMRAAVLPALTLRATVGDDEVSRDRLQDRDALAAICQLAGKQTKPDRPLRYQRLRSDRALFNLSRLPVPCRGEGDGIEWVPAYRAYFGRDWIGEESVETILDVLPEEQRADLPPIPFLIGPKRFPTLLGESVEVREQATESEDDEPQDEEVGLDEDADLPVETDERERWLAFLSWIGANRSLRLVHFHDVEDGNTGWLTTKGLVQPQGWAFRHLQRTWQEYERELRARIASDADADGKVVYLYECHDLEAIEPLLASAEMDRSGAVGRALLNHLVRHWSALAPFSEVELALVPDGRWPSSRSKPQRALPEERTKLGDDLWLHRLRTRSFCPTSHGPRRAATAWLPSREIDRRLGRGGREVGELLPLLLLDDGLLGGPANDLASRLDVRLELTPSTFRPADAFTICERLEGMFSDLTPVEFRTALRTVIRPTYREMFELLSGRASAATSELAEAPLVAEVGGSEAYAFLPARDILYAQTPGSRERSGVLGKVPTFVLEAEPGATAPLRNIFGTPTLEEALTWEPSPGEPALDGGELERFRSHLRAMVPALLARLRVERHRTDDPVILEQFVERVEPVTELRLACWLRDEQVMETTSRPYFVKPRRGGEPLQVFVVWEGAPWPPVSEAAQALAMALAEALGVNLVETFLAFIDGDDHRRRRLLDLAGASRLLDEGTAVPGVPELVDVGKDVEPTPAPEAGEYSSEPARLAPVAPVPAPARVPLVSFADLRISGHPILVSGEGGTGSAGGNRGAGPTESSESSSVGPRAPMTTPRAAPGTDLSELDELGMRVAMTYEALRLQREGRSVGVIAAWERETDATSVVVDVSTPAAIADAIARSAMVKDVFDGLRRRGISELYPGFDVLTIVEGSIGRAIELKSSGVDARVQNMSWNEWKSARNDDLRARFWLYLVGNLRADIPGAPFLRAINDPFGRLMGQETSEKTVRRAVQLRVREFTQAEHIDLEVLGQDEA
jgi:hypothetical protein